LTSLNISVLIDNPNVGENLQDHLMTGIGFEVKEGVRTRDPMVCKEPDAVQTAKKMYTEAEK
jgi:choline dehydrogenase-like flavoprotein